MSRKSRDNTQGGTSKQPCVPVTLEELHFATTVAYSASTNRMQRTSFRGSFEEAMESCRIEPGNYLVLSDIPENHAAMAILDAFPDKSTAGEAKRKSLLWRVMFVIAEATTDARAKRYLIDDNGQAYIDQALMEAMAVVPMNLGEAIPLDAIFEKANELWEADPGTASK